MTASGRSMPLMVRNSSVSEISYHIFNFVQISHLYKIVRLSDNCFCQFVCMVGAFVFIIETFYGYVWNSLLMQKSQLVIAKKTLKKRNRQITCFLVIYRFRCYFNWTSLILRQEHSSRHFLRVLNFSYMSLIVQFLWKSAKFCYLSLSTFSNLSCITALIQP